MKLNKIPLSYLKGDCLPAGDKLRDLGAPTLSLADYLSIMYVNGEVTPPTPDSSEAENSNDSKSHAELDDNVSSSGIVTITKVYPWYLS